MLRNHRYHKQFTHGISSVSGAPFAMPVQTRKASENSATEGLCHQCNGWIVFTTKRQDANEQSPVPTLWYKVGVPVLVALRPRVHD